MSVCPPARFLFLKTKKIKFTVGKIFFNKKNMFYKTDKKIFKYFAK